MIKNDKRGHKKHRTKGLKVSISFFLSHVVIRQLKVAMVIISVLPQSVQKYSLWHTDPHLRQDKRGSGTQTSNTVTVLGSSSPSLHTPNCPSQDVVCRLWSGTSCASTPNTSCP